MKKALFSSTLLLIILLCCGCGEKSLPEDEYTEIKAGEVQIREIISEQLLLYTEDSLGIQLYSVLSEPKRYCIKYGEMEAYMDVEGDISSIKAEAWGEDNIFIVIQFEKNEGNKIYIVESENLGEIKIKNPYEIASQYITMDVSEEECKLYLQLAQKQIEISASSDSILKAISNVIKPSGTISFANDETGLYCTVPVIIGEDNMMLGYIRLNYEFDGVGLNCVSAEFFE